MDYPATLAWMYERLPMFQRMGAAAYKADLFNIHLLAQHLGNPHNQFKTIHIAGTNGKGSTSHMLASVLQEAGYRVGLYTSPHLKDFRERIRLNGKMVKKKFVVDFVETHRDFIEKNKLSFFELTVGMAFDAFAKADVDVAIIEVGMGGLLDATNIITPLVSVITNIGLDHTQFLGTTLPEIAKEKAGIIKENVPVIIGELQPETAPVFVKIATEKEAQIYFASAKDTQEFTTSLKGAYQKHNLKTVLTTLDVLRANGHFRFTEAQVQQGLQKVTVNTGLRGRWETLGESPKIICDTGHNKEGLEYVTRQLKEQPYERLHIVLGTVSDKDLSGVLPLFPKDANYYFCKPNIPRGLDAEALLAKATEFDLRGSAFNSVALAFAEAKKKAAMSDMIFVGGSNFTVAEVI
ncbi:MAG: folylpolyglutamate synthase/dihydrofolate synthase family protein [Leeuwenhoekiella sp.]